MSLDISLLYLLRTSSWWEWLPLGWRWSFLNLLVYAMRDWYSLPIFSSWDTIQAYSCEHSSHSLLKVINFLLAKNLWMKESHDLGRPFKVVITISPFSNSSSTTSSCSLIWETHVKYDYMVSSFWIFTFFNWFLKVIFWFIFFPSNSLVKESNISLGVFGEDTYFDGINNNPLGLDQVLLV